MDHTRLPPTEQDENNHSLVGEEDPYTEPHQRLMADTDVEVINRASGEITPFSEIRKQAATTSAKNIIGYGIEIRDPEHDNGWRPAGNVSQEYMVVDNREVVETAERIVQESPFAKTPRKIFFDGKRFVYSFVFPNQDIEGPRGESITFGLQFRNSYNGSMAFRGELYAERQVCVNGMVSTEHFADHTFKHTHGNEGWQEELEEAMSVLHTAPDRLEHFVSDLYALEDTSIESEDLMYLRHGDSGLGNLPVSRFGEVYDELVDETNMTQASGYDLLNAATSVLWHRDRSVTDLEYNQEVVDQLTDYAHEYQN